MKNWKMPRWMEKYRTSFNNTGGNTVEECMNSREDIRVNLPMWTIGVMVKAQVGMLTKLYEDKKIN